MFKIEFYIYSVFLTRNRPIKNQNSEKNNFNSPLPLGVPVPGLWKKLRPNTSTQIHKKLRKFIFALLRRDSPLKEFCTWLLHLFLKTKIIEQNVKLLRFPRLNFLWYDNFPHWLLGIAPDSCSNYINDLWGTRSSWSTTSRIIFSAVQLSKPMNSVINSWFWCFKKLYFLWNWSCPLDESQW